MSGALDGKRLVITGVLTRGSIAFAVAERAQEDGAEVVLTSFGRARRLTERAAAELPGSSGRAGARREQGRALRGAGRRARVALGRGRRRSPRGRVRARGRAGGRLPRHAARVGRAGLSHERLLVQGDGVVAAPLMREGGSLVGLTFDASVAWPVYDWMGVSKAALESVSRYLARDLGGQGVRVNLVAAGPVSTPAAGGIPGFERLASMWGAQAPLGWDTEDAAPVAEAVCFLLSDRRAGDQRRDPARGRRLPRDGRPARALAIIARMLLVVDVGNTQTHVGMFDGDRLVEHWRFATVRFATADELATGVASLLGLRGCTSATWTRRSSRRSCPRSRTSTTSSYALSGRQRDARGPLAARRACRSGSTTLWSSAPTGWSTPWPPTTGWARRASRSTSARRSTTTSCPAGRVPRRGDLPGIEVSLEALAARAARLPRVDIEARATRSARALRRRSSRGWSTATPARWTHPGRLREELGEEATAIATGGFAPVDRPVLRPGRRGGRPPHPDGPEARLRAQPRLTRSSRAPTRNARPGMLRPCRIRVTLSRSRRRKNVTRTKR